MTSAVENPSLAEQFIVDIIGKYMELKADQIWIRNQTRKIPNDDGLYVTVGFVDGVPYSSKSEIETVGITPPGDADPYEEVRETVTLHVGENIQIDIYSRNNDSLFRRWEILQALASIYSKQAQEKYDFKIARVPKNFLNSSMTEGGSTLNKFSCLVTCLTMHSKQKVLESNSGQYYDDFRTRVDDEQSIGTGQGIVEFEIDPNTEPQQGD